MGNRSGLVPVSVTNTVFFSDFSSNFSVSPLTEQLAIIVNQQDVIDSIQRLVRLAPFEREYENVGGGVVQKFLFEPISAVTGMTLQEAITTTITSYEPRAILKNVVVTPYVARQTYVVDITFSMVNIPGTATFQMILQKIR